MKDADPGVTTQAAKTTSLLKVHMVSNVPISAHWPGIGGRMDEAEEDPKEMPCPCHP